jgi:polysaccharide biosynthesis protein PslJ
MAGTGFGAPLALLPLGCSPGIDVSLDLPFADGVVLIAFAHRGDATPFHPLVKLLIVFVIVSGVSLIFTGHTLTDAAEFISWTFNNGRGHQLC